MSLLQRKYGCWIVGGVAFDHKMKALQYASETNNTSVEFYYHNSIWDQFDRKLLGKIPLTTLYKERAQQLRDTYDHLVLHYSGGSDSHNILETFITNNIKLDEVSVRWAKPLRDGKFYTANNKDKTARNGVSEWDYAIKPELDKLRATHPEIKITLVDFTDNLDTGIVSENNLENRIIDLNFYRGCLATLTQRLDPSIEDKSTIISGKKKIAHIFGIEKPYVSINGDNIDIYFQDSQLDGTIMPRNYEEESVEFFYWSPNFPLLPMEQAYQLALLIRNDEATREIFRYEGLPQNDPIRRAKVDAITQITKQVLYSNSWDFSKFQAGKPNGSRSDWWFWLHESSELNLLHKNFIQVMKNITHGIDSRLILVSQDTHTLVPTRTKFFNLLKIT